MSLVSDVRNKDGFCVNSKSNGQLPQQQQQQQQQTGNGFVPSSINIPLTCIENVELRELFYIHIFCKDARFYLVQFCDTLICKEWFVRISSAIAQPASVEQVNKPICRSQV